MYKVENEGKELRVRQFAIDEYGFLTPGNLSHSLWLDSKNNDKRQHRLKLIIEAPGVQDKGEVKFENIQTDKRDQCIECSIMKKRRPEVGNEHQFEKIWPMGSANEENEENISFTSHPIPVDVFQNNEQQASPEEADKHIKSVKDGVIVLELGPHVHYYKNQKKPENPKAPVKKK